MDVKRKIEQFYDGALSFDEEQELYRYLCDNDVPAELQRDKEAIIALCKDTNDYSLPEGADKRLEAMLDALENERLLAESVEVLSPAPILKGRKIPIYHRIATVAAAIIAIFFIARWGGGRQTYDEWAMPEQDTFSCPEEARECARRAFGELFWAMNTAQEHTREIGYTLEQSAQQARVTRTTVK